LAEELEHLFQHLRRNSNTYIANARNDLGFVTPHLDHNAITVPPRLRSAHVLTARGHHLALVGPIHSELRAQSVFDAEVIAIRSIFRASADSIHPSAFNRRITSARTSPQ
jgi:hypothetical protein